MFFPPCQELFSRAEGCFSLFFVCFLPASHLCLSICGETAPVPPQAAGSQKLSVFLAFFWYSYYTQSTQKETKRKGAVFYE